jgi:hypothetical protein
MYSYKEGHSLSKVMRAFMVRAAPVVVLWDEAFR